MVRFSLASQPTSARREGSGELSIQLLSPAHWILRSNQIVRWKWQGVQRIKGKAGTWFILGRKVCLCCSADWIGYNKSFCCASWYFSMGQTTTQRHCLVVSLLAAIMKDLVALSKWSMFLCLHGLIVTALCCTD